MDEAGKMGLNRSLSGGDRKSIGHANEVADLVLQQPEKVSELVECLWSEDAVVRMRAANAACKVFRSTPELLSPFKAELIGLSEECEQPEVAWHLAIIVANLPLTPSERKRTKGVLLRNLASKSSILKAKALQGLADLTKNSPTEREETIELLEKAARTGTAAMKARARILLKKL